MRIGVDIMGGDCPPEKLIEGILDSRLAIIATEEVAKRYQHLHSDWIIAREVIEMDDDPLTALRSKRRATMTVGAEALKAGEIDALISVGNTGALVGTARRTVGSFSRPALLALIPTAKGAVAVLDVGASVSAKAEDLLALAKIGARFQKGCGIDPVRVGLLNIGSEEMKGRKELREAYQMLTQESEFDFVGNIESFDVFKGAVDLLVTDGFSGNIFLKTTEGLAGFLLDLFAKHATMSGNEKVMQEMLERIDTHLGRNHYPGAILLGIDGIVIKCHGKSSAKEIMSSVEWASEMIKHKLLEGMKT
ncbi:MAG: hypothetical protein MRY21_04375 [Simkaniaceae bacterium]|nr:hypothetical protein [Simkaniaceae bacterium]